MAQAAKSATYADLLALRDDIRTEVGELVTAPAPLPVTRQCKVRLDVSLVGHSMTMTATAATGLADFRRG
jgi:hypothetical protein